MLQLSRARLPMHTTSPWWAFVLAGLAYGLFTALAFPPVGVWPLSLVSTVPLAWAGCSAVGHQKRAAVLTALGTLPFWLVESWWLWNVAQIGMPLLCLYLALYPAIFVWALAHARRADWPIPMAIVVPVLWTTLEVLRGELVMGGYAWYLAGHPLADAPLLAAPAAILGAYGVSFLCAALAGAVADAAGWSGIPRSIGGMGAIVLIVMWPVMGWIGGRELAESNPGPELRVGVVQTNLPQDNKMEWSTLDRLRDMRHWVDLTKQAGGLRPPPDVITWPETMFPGPSLNEGAAKALDDLGMYWRVSTPDGEKRVPVDRFRDDLLKVQQDVGVPMLVGSGEMEGDVRRFIESDRKDRSAVRLYNSVVLVDRGRTWPVRYDKVELTPFGEVIPYLWRWPEIQQFVIDLGAKGMTFDLSMGERVGPIDLPVSRGEFGSPTVRVATPICFEVTRSDLVRRMVRGRSGGDAPGRASIIMNFSNDGWFGPWDPGRMQHLLAARWRCIELGVPMVRCVNTGVSCWIDGKGRVRADRLVERERVEVGVAGAGGLGGVGGNVRMDGVLAANVPIAQRHSPTTFERFGLLPAYGVMVAGVVGTLVLWFRSRKVAGGVA